MHVIQTFVSLDKCEERQIKGRTARQQKEGSYSMILREDELEGELQIASSVQESSQDQGYTQIREACSRVQGTKFQGMEKKLTAARERHTLTTDYLRHLCAKEQQAAAASFKN